MEGHEYEDEEVVREADEERAASAMTPAPADELKKLRREIGDDDSREIPIPGYRGKLVARYRRLEYDEVRRIANKFARSKHPDKDLRTQALTIAAACEEILVRRAGEDSKLGEPEPLANAIPGYDGVVRYDDRLAEFLGFDGKGSAIRVVLGTFNNDLAVVPHHTELNVWFQSSRDVDEEDEDGDPLDPTGPS